MDVVHSVKLYLNRMIEECGVGLKVLLMDKETTSIVSVVFTQSAMLAKEVYLFERIDRCHLLENMKYLKCIVFVRPTRENMNHLCRELRSPKFGQYFIYFSNIISKTDVKMLAECDEYEVVRDIQEFYCDFIAVSPHLMSLNLSDGCYHGTLWKPECLERSVEGIISCLLALRKYPTIRYQSSSTMCQKLAERVKHVLNKEGSLFNFKSSNYTGDTNIIPPVLLILDRRSDVVTPLLNQWTYQAMLHELLTINNNRINLSEVPTVSKEMKEVVLSAEHDEFYEQNMYLNYGEIGANIKALMEEFQTKTKSQQKVETISDMKAFIEQYPQFKKMSGTVSKHVTLIGELSRLITAFSLFEVSEAEQELACQSNHSESLKKVRRLISSENVRFIDALRLVLLYALRYEKQSNSDLYGLTETLKKRAPHEGNPSKIVKQMLKFNLKNQSQNASDLLTTENMKSFTKNMIKGLKGVENIYTQHSPMVKEVIEELAKGRLKASQYPYLGTVQLTEKPLEIVVFMIGGMTYEESLAVHQLNKCLGGAKVILCSTSIHNFSSFLNEVQNAATNISTVSSSSDF
ncbi:Vacuolar protein sorting-associated protein 45-like protein [Leptotrombidium deliense]|uniref:Vacuolar protein sorting-associated protein 45 n=1 Tax=Leptotrombidium deliense TaxID=299467 RepID=A0A443S7T5_9ACAR|nr:Vacuolar protein sorting-associated protein 45-like protein [Leptotrombidium deliense]